MAWAVHAVDASGQLDAALDPIVAAIDWARARIETVFPARALDVVVPRAGLRPPAGLG